MGYNSWTFSVSFEITISPAFIKGFLFSGLIVIIILSVLLAYFI
jgi:hypothetical protein